MSALVLSLVFLLGMTASANDVVRLPMIAETWDCSYKDGKGVDDVLKARDFMVSQAEKVGVKLPTAFLWDLNKGDSSINHVWFNVHANINAYGESADAIQASGIADKISERFSSVSDCVVGMGEAQMVFPRDKPAKVPEPPVFVVSQSCRYINGANQKSLNQLVPKIDGIMKSMGDNAPAFSTVLMPFTLRTSEASDVIIYSGFNNATGWANYVRDLASTERGQQLQGYMAEVLDCAGLTLWSSQRVL